MPKIDKVYAFVVENSPGDEKVVAKSIILHMTEKTERKFWLPMLAVSEEALESLIPEARAMSDKLNKPIKIISFGTPQEVAILWPSGPPVESEGPERLK